MLTTTTLTNNGTLGWTVGATLNIAAGGTLTNNTGASFTGGSGTVNFAGAGIINGTAAITFNNLTINAGTLTFSTVPTIGGNFLINNGNVSAAPVYGSGSTLIYNNGSTYNAYNEWTAGATSGAGVPANVQVGNGTANSALGFSNSAGVYTMTGNLSITSNTGAALTLNSGGGTLNVGGNWSDAGTFTGTAGTVNFNGGGAQSIANSSGETFYNLKISNTSTGVTMINNVQVTNILTLNTGVITPGANTLSVTNTGSGGIYGGGTGSYINGAVSLGLSRPAWVRVLPIYSRLGASSTYYPFTLTNPTTGAQGITVVTVSATQGNAGGTGDGTTLTAGGLSTTEYWTASFTGAYTGGSVSLGRQTAVAPYNAIGRSTGGNYSSLGGTASGDNINLSNTTGNT